MRGREYEKEVNRFFDDIKSDLYRRFPKRVPNVLVHPFFNMPEFSSYLRNNEGYPNRLRNYEIEHEFAYFLIYDPFRKFGDLGGRYLEFFLTPEREDAGTLIEYLRAHHS